MTPTGPNYEPNCEPNYEAMQTPRDPTTKKCLKVGGVKPKHLAMGSWHAVGGSGGTLSARKRKKMKSSQ